MLISLRITRLVHGRRYKAIINIGFVGDGQSFEAIINIEEYEGVPFQSTEGGKNKNYVMNEDETTLAHKRNQRKIHTQLTNEIVGKKLKRPISAIRSTELSHEDIQKKDKDEEEHSYVMLTELDKDLRLMEEWLINPKIEEDCIKVVDMNKERCL